MQLHLIWTAWLVATECSLNNIFKPCPATCSYEELGKAVLGEKLGFWAVATTQFVLLVGLMVTYMVTAGQSLQAATNPMCNDHTMQVRCCLLPDALDNSTVWWSQSACMISLPCRAH